MASSAAQGLMQSQWPKAQDVAVVVAKEKEELERLSADRLGRLSALGLRSAGFLPRAACLGAKPPVMVTRASATASQNLSGMPVGKHGILTVRPKITTTRNLTGFQSLAQLILPTTFEQAAPSYSPSTPPAEEVVERVVVEVPSERVAAEVLGE